MSKNKVSSGLSDIVGVKEEAVQSNLFEDNGEENENETSFLVGVPLAYFLKSFTPLREKHHQVKKRILFALGITTLKANFLVD